MQLILWKKKKKRNSASDTIKKMEEATAGFGDTDWETGRIRRRKDKGSDLAIKCRRVLRS